MSEIKPVQPVTPVEPDRKPQPQPVPLEPSPKDDEFKKELEKQKRLFWNPGQIISVADYSEAASEAACNSGQTFSAHLDNILKMEIFNPSDCLHWGHLKEGKLGGWPALYPGEVEIGGKMVKCLILESCWGWANEDRIYVAQATVEEL